ncbi:hypothetical protein CCR75_003245 [Bremia lactucae]|uniref:Uncharacterized protein n=1 Tax=Bremia lactucae TaxID=4779 RepID=A0A976FKH3_BRELC|nr:hypothetical protein CCR75_003245 [Bremia lactucae]
MFKYHIQHANDRLAVMRANTLKLYRACSRTLRIYFVFVMVPKITSEVFRQSSKSCRTLTSDNVSTNQTKNRQNSPYGLADEAVAVFSRLKRSIQNYEMIYSLYQNLHKIGVREEEGILAPCDKYVARKVHFSMQKGFNVYS